MLPHIKDSTLWTLSLIASGFQFLITGCVALYQWSAAFVHVGELYKQFIPKLILIIIGYYLTPLPLIVLALLAFLPLGFSYAVLLFAFFAAFVRV